MKKNLVALAIIWFLTGCGAASTSSQSTAPIVFTTASGSATFPAEQVPVGAYSVALDKCGKPASRGIVLALKNGDGSADVRDAPTLVIGGTVNVSATGTYEVIPSSADAQALINAESAVCYPWAVTLTPTGH